MLNSFRESYKDHTVYYKTVKEDVLVYWQDRGYDVEEVFEEMQGQKVYSIRKTCPFVVLNSFQEIFDVIEDGRAKGVADRHGNILVPCEFANILIGITETPNKVCSFFFICYGMGNMSIIPYPQVDSLSEQLHLTILETDDTDPAIDMDHTKPLPSKVFNALVHQGFDFNYL